MAVPRIFSLIVCLSSFASGAPAPKYDDSYSNSTSFGPGSQVPAIPTSPPRGNQPGAAPPRVSNGNLSGSPTMRGPYSGSPTTVGAVQAPTTLATAIEPLPPNPTATYYNADGTLTDPAPAPYTPAGGLGTNGTEPRYLVNSDFDFESVALGLYQEWIELDLFYSGLQIFSEEDFHDAGLTVEDRGLIKIMAEQETGHATLLTNMLGEAAPVQCTYNYPFTTVREFLDFNEKITRFGEAGTLGFINHLDAREVGHLLTQSITTESRQQIIFRQLSGLPSMPTWFQPAIPQSWHWTYLAPYISSCPENCTRLAWQNFPNLFVLNQPNINRISPNNTKLGELTTGDRVSDPSRSDVEADQACINVKTPGYSCSPGIARDRFQPLSFPGKKVFFEWDEPGKSVGPNNSYVTSTTAGPPAFVAWVSQLNLTYTPLTITGTNKGETYQPASEVFEGHPAVNGTMFVALTDDDPFLTPFNLTLINPHVVALGLYRAG